MKKIKPYLFLFAASAFSFVPLVSSAQNGTFSITSCTTRVRNFKELVMNMFIGCVVEPLIPIMFSIAGLIFLWGVFNFIRAEGDNKQKAKDFIVWGIIGLTVMFSLWGLVNLLQYTFRLDNTNINIRPVNTSGLNI